jgi:hypothetical protein
VKLHETIKSFYEIVKVTPPFLKKEFVKKLFREKETQPIDTNIPNCALT